MEIVLLLLLLLLFAGFWPLKLRNKLTRDKNARVRQAKKKFEPFFNTKSTTPQPSKPAVRGFAYVVDGDTLIIQKIQIRLFGIDAPEINHPYGIKSKWALFSLCKGQTVRAEFIGNDAYGRTVARCCLPDGRDLSAEMVKLGLAIDWPKFSNGKYRSLEMPDARKKLWLADARQNGRMHVWEQFETKQKALAKKK